MRDKFPLAAKALKGKTPVWYDQMGQMIFTKDGKMLLDVRGWGWIQKLDQPEETQDQVGQLMVELINGAL